MTTIVGKNEKNKEIFFLNTKELQVSKVLDDGLL